MSVSVSSEPLKKTPLYEQHLRMQAKMVGFGGWDMPLQYEGILAEYQSTRNQVAVFDTCHMGEFFLHGDCKKIGLDRLVSSRIENMPLKSCRYGVTLNREGGVIDDLIVYRVDAEEWMIVVNASTMPNDESHFLTHLSSKSVFKNISAQTGKLDVQGPNSQKILQSLIPGIEKLKYYCFDQFIVLGENVIVSRTGYTGELGYEIYFPWARMPELWREIFKAPGVYPAGLGVRDVLRVEMGYSLYGHELDETISPLEAGLSKFVDFEKDFIGRDALLAQKKKGVPRKIAYFASVNRRSPRSHNRIFSPSREDIGVVTSGTFSPSLQRGIGIGFISTGDVPQNAAIHFGDEKMNSEALLTRRPFYTSKRIA